MIGVLKISGKSKVLYLKNRKREGFMVIRESNKENPLPEGYYVVRLVEYRKKRNKVYPYLSLVKTLPRLGESPEEIALALSETSSQAQKEVVEILGELGLCEEDISRIKNILNCIALHDKGELLWQEEPEEDEFLEDLCINIQEVRRRYYEILRAEQDRKGENLQGGLSAGGSPAERKERRQNKPHRAGKERPQALVESSKVDF